MTPCRPHAPTSGLLRWLVVLASLALALLATAPIASAEGIPKLTGQVTDSSGVLAGQEQEIQSALDQVLKDHHVQVFVLYVKNTGDLTSTEFADQTAARNSLGGDDALVLVAIDERTDAIWVSDALPSITDAEIDRRSRVRSSRASRPATSPARRSRRRRPWERPTTARHPNRRPRP